MSLYILGEYYESREKDKFIEHLNESELKGELINVIWRNGSFLSDMLRDNEPEYMELVLNYYRRNFLEKELDVEKRNKLEKKLGEIIDYVVEDEEISPEMREVLFPYIDTDECPETPDGFTYDEDIEESSSADRHSSDTAETTDVAVAGAIDSE